MVQNIQSTSSVDSTRSLDSLRTSVIILMNFMMGQQSEGQGGIEG